MTKDEINDFIGGIVEKDKCRHEWEEVGNLHRFNCIKCGKDTGNFNYIPLDNTDYLTPDGIAKVKNYLMAKLVCEPIGWGNFINFIRGQLRESGADSYNIALICDIVTDPKKCCLKFVEFIQYAKENNLGGK